MTVEELIQALKNENPKAEIGFAYPVGDYWNTLAVGGVAEVAETTVVVEDGYGYEGYLPRSSPDEYDEIATMVVLSR